VIAGSQTIFENGVAKQTYDPNRSYLENVRERIMTIENGKYMRNEIKNSEYSKIILERERKEKLWLLAFCVAAAIIFSFYRQKTVPLFFLQMFQAIGGALAILIPLIIITLLFKHFTKIKWHYVFTVSCFIIAFLMFVGTKR
jgi:hypothetical protein